MSASPSQIAANQANAQKSTGPTSAEGKQRSSLNALKTGLTGRTVLMPGEDAEAYRLHCERFEDQFQPATSEEKELVQSLADLRWRLLRCAQLETTSSRSAASSSPKPSTTNPSPFAPPSSRPTPCEATRKI